jgi:hypothetical protein
MKLFTTLKLFVPVALCCATANASTVVDFNFDTDNLGTTTTFADTVNGLSATFSSAADPGGFVVFPTMFETLTGNVLGNPGPAFAFDIPLDVNFSGSLSAITLDFATGDFANPSPFTIAAYENSTLVGSSTSTGQFLPGFTFPEGEITFDAGTFNNVVISTPSPNFAVDNIQVLTATAPEPGSFTMLAAGLCLSGAGVIRRRRSLRK